MKKLTVSLAAFATTILPAFGLTILEDSFEAPILPTSITYYKYLSAGDLPGWTVINDGRGEQPFLINEVLYAGRTGYPDFFGSQALTLNEGSGIQKTISLLAGQTYSFSIWGYGNSELPLEIQIGLHTEFLNFEHWREGGLKERTFSFTASENDEDAILRIYNPIVGADYHERVLDNITISTVSVPDGGSTAILLGLGVMGLYAARRTTLRKA